MATKKEKPAKPPKKKEKPTPKPCTCGRLPVAARARGRGWIVACPAVNGCTNCTTSGWWPTQDQAVEKWNTAVMALLYKEAQK